MECQIEKKLHRELRLMVEGLEISQDGDVQRRDYGAADNDSTVKQMRLDLLEHQNGCAVCNDWLDGPVDYTLAKPEHRNLI